MIIIDANALVVLMIGFIEPSLLKKHKRTSLYDEEDFYELLSVIGNIKELIVLPNVWTEVDNLLNSFKGNYKFQYVKKIKEVIEKSTETYLSSKEGSKSDSFYDLGLTDSLILKHAINCKLLITSDSELSDYAHANGVIVYDMVKRKNEKLG